MTHAEEAKKTENAFIILQKFKQLLVIVELFYPNKTSMIGIYQKSRIVGNATYDPAFLVEDDY
ncbi:hypothetical protein GCM10028805_38220 [Spirosoma harenae]